MKLGELYNQIEAKKRRIMQNAVEIVPKWAEMPYPFASKKVVAKYLILSHI